MRVTHEHDCAIHRSPICDCGVLLKASRLGNVPGLDQHRAAIKAIVDIGNQEFADDVPKLQQAIEEIRIGLPRRPWPEDKEDSGAPG